MFLIKGPKLNRWGVNMLKFAGLCLTLIISSLSAPAAAQMTGSRLGKNATSQDAKAVFDNMVRCVGERSPKYAEQVLQQMPGSEAERRKIFGNEGDLSMCMDDQRRRVVLPANVELTMNARMFRTALARTMARSAIEDVAPDQLATAPAWSSAIYVADADSEGEVDRIQIGLYAMGDCVIAAKPAEAVSFILHGPKNKRGAEALKQIVPILGSCVTQGTQLELTPDTVTVALAEPMYHRMQALKQKGVEKSS